MPRKRKLDATDLRDVRAQFLEDVPAEECAELFELPVAAVRRAYQDIQAELDDYPEHDRDLVRELWACRIRSARILRNNRNAELQEPTCPEEELNNSERGRLERLRDRTANYEKDLNSLSRLKLQAATELRKPAGAESTKRQVTLVTVNTGEPYDGDTPRAREDD